VRGGEEEEDIVKSGDFKVVVDDVMPTEGSCLRFWTVSLIWELNQHPTQ